MNGTIHLALSTSDGIQLAIAIITALAAVIALVNVAVTTTNERRRAQPIVIAHADGDRRFAGANSPAAWVLNAYLTSEGSGAAYNVRFGVELNGVRYPYRLTVDDPHAGNLQRVLRPGERRPETDSWPILIDSLSLWGRAADSKRPGDLDAKRIYWARYENAQGQTWETRNPGDRSARLNIRRVRRPGRQERREQRIRTEAGQRDHEWIRTALEELRPPTESTPESTASEE